MLPQLDPTTQSRLRISAETVSTFCQKWGIVSMALFGSILRADFDNNSDIDILIAFSPTARQGLLTLSQIKRELESVVQRSVDIAVKESIEESTNWIRKREILATAKTVYEQTYQYKHAVGYRTERYS
ncbi:MAG: nucleotidyltransferase domain-containing protein [Cyanobacteria bacterium J06555_13]